MAASWQDAYSECQIETSVPVRRDIPIMSISNCNCYCSQTAATPEQRAAAMPWLIAWLAAKGSWSVLFLFCLLFGYLIPDHAVFRATVALCAVAFLVDPFVESMCFRKLDRIRGDCSKTSPFGWTGWVLRLAFRGFFAYLAFRTWVFPPS